MGTSFFTNRERKNPPAIVDIGPPWHAQSALERNNPAGTGTRVVSLSL